MNNSEGIVCAIPGMQKPPDLHGAETELIEISTFRKYLNQQNMSHCLVGTMITDRNFNSFALLETMKRA